MKCEEETTVEELFVVDSDFLVILLARIKKCLINCLALGKSCAHLWCLSACFLNNFII